MRFALPGLTSLALHGALLGAALGVTWTVPPAESPRIEADIVFGQPLAAPPSWGPAPVAVEELQALPPPLPAEAAKIDPPVAVAAPIGAAAEEAIARAAPAASSKPMPRVKRPALASTPRTPPEQPPLDRPTPAAAVADGVANEEQAGRKEPAAFSTAGGIEVALSALPWQPKERRGSNAPPSYGGNPAPVYPAAARRRGQQGQVVVLAEVDANGRASRVEVTRSSGFELLDEAALTSVREWRFAPAEIDGVRSAGAIEVPITFKLVD
jgi:protein TonB